MLSNLFQKHFTEKNILFAFGVIVFLLLITKMQDIALMFFASFVIACSLNPVVNKLNSIFPKLKRQTASVLVLFGTLLIVVLFFIPLVVLTGNEIKVFAVSFPQYSDNIKTFLENSPIAKQLAAVSYDVGGIISMASGVTSKIINEAIDVGKNLSTVFVYLIVSIIIIFYFLADKNTLKTAYSKMFPKQMRNRALDVLNIISKKTGGYVVGTIAAMASVFVIMTVGLLILRVDCAVLLGLITAILDIVPVVGPFIALVICFILAYKSGFVVLALIAVIFGLAQIVENNFVKPYVFGKLLDLHPILIYLFLFITAKYMGVLGVIFAPAIAAVVCVLIEELYIKNLE